MGTVNYISLKERLRKGEFVLGTWCEIPSPELINVLAKAGLDFVIIDMEHGAMDFTTCFRMVIAAQVEGCTPLIRVSGNNEPDILRSLETGAEGIIVPHIESVKDREKAVAYMKFPPAGKRSLNPYTRAGGYQVLRDYTKQQNKNLLSCLIVEGKNGILELEKILDNNEVDAIYIGTYDISLALGVPGDTGNKKVIETLKKMVKLIRNKNKIAGCMFHTNKELKLFKKIGIQLLCYKVDTGVIFDAFNKLRS